MGIIADKPRVEQTKADPVAKLAHEKADAAKSFIDRMVCGGKCRRQHPVVDIREIAGAC